MGQYLFTGSETTSVWLEVVDTSGENVNCLVKNAATLAGPIFTLHVSQVHISLPTLSEYDKQVMWTTSQLLYTSFIAQYSCSGLHFFCTKS